jgi:hypothetical protein
LYCLREVFQIDVRKLNTEEINILFWSHIKILRDVHRLRVYENWVLRRIFEPRRHEVTGEWRKLHNEEVSDMYSSPNIVQVIKWRRMRWVGHVVCMSERRGVEMILVGDKTTWKT